MPPPTVLDHRSGKAGGPAIDHHRHCEERSDVAIRSLSVPRGGRAMLRIAEDADCHGPMGLAMTMVNWGWFFWFCTADIEHGRQFWRIGRAIHESPLRYWSVVVCVPPRWGGGTARGPFPTIENAPSGFGWGVFDAQVLASMHSWILALTMAAISVVFMPAYSS